MSDCDVMRESMPLLLTESLDAARRELTHQHIESCAACGEEWLAYNETWRVMGDLPELEVPAHVKQKFLAQVMPAEERTNVVPFRRRAAFKWVAQAAAVAVVAGGAYFAGHRPTTPTFAKMAPAVLTPASPYYSIAETRVLPANAVS